MMIGQAIKIRVLWYDRVPEPPVNEEHEGEVIGWHGSQVAVRVKGYSVLRFWSKNGFEVGNKDHGRRGFFLAIEQVNTKPIADGITVYMEE